MIRKIILFVQVRSIAFLLALSMTYAITYAITYAKYKNIRKRKIL